MGRGCSKTKITCRLLIIIGGFFIWSNFSSGATNQAVINEIAWMGTDISSSDEWLELYNNTGGEIDLTGWTLKAVDGTPEITLEGIIAANGYFLLERTNDDSVPNVVADQIYTGPLSNTGENLELRDSQNNLIDQVDCSEGWFAGNNPSKQTMEKINNDWQTSLDAGGTPKAENSSGAEMPPEEPSEEPTIEETGDGATVPDTINQPPIAQAGPDITALVNQEIVFDASQSTDPNNDTLTFFWNFGDGATDTEQISKHTYLFPGQYIIALLISDGEFFDLDIITVNIYNRSIIISEFIPNPEGTDTENEWIELFNQSDQIANLTNWQLDDQEGGSKPFIFPANSLIAPHQFLVLRRPITKLSLNNDNDQVRLIYPDGSLAAEVSYYAEKKQGFSIAFDGQDYFWTKIPTPGSANIISSADLNNQKENISKNNPVPNIEETQEMPDVLAKANLIQSQNLLAENPPNQNSECLLDSCIIEENSIKEENITLKQKQTASLAQSSQKANLILILSIIISGSLLASWFLILLRKRLKIRSLL